MLRKLTPGTTFRIHWHPCSTKWFSCHHHEIRHYVVTSWNNNVFQTGLIKCVLKNIVYLMHIGVRGKLVKCWRMTCWHFWTGICSTLALNCHHCIHFCDIPFDALEERKSQNKESSGGKGGGSVPHHVFGGKHFSGSEGSYSVLACPGKCGLHAS